MGFFRTFGSHLGAGLAGIVLDRIAPPPPSIVQQIVDEAPKVLGVLTMIANVVRAAVVPIEQTRTAEAVANYERRKGHPIPHDVINGHVVPAIRADDFPPFKKLGEFTCPKCGGHTWSTLDLEKGRKYCTNGLETAYPEHNPNTVGQPCMFTWHMSDDHKYFAPPIAEDLRSARSQACVTTSDGIRVPGRADALSEFLAVKFPDEAKHGEWPEVLAMRLLGHLHTLRDLMDPLAAAVGDRRDKDESFAAAAVRLLGEADAFIAKQAAEIARQTDVIKGYKFAVGCGEIQIHDTGTLCLGADGWSLRTDDGSKVTTVPVSAKEAAAFLSTATGTLFEAHAIGSPMGRMNEYAKESAERSAIKDAIATSDAEVSASDYVERQAPRYNRAEIAMERTHCASCGAERGRKCAADCANSDRLKVKP